MAEISHKKARMGHALPVQLKANGADHPTFNQIVALALTTKTDRWHIRSVIRPCLPVVVPCIIGITPDAQCLL